MAVTSESTGFFNNGKVLTTCRHSYHNWFHFVIQANPGRRIETLSPPIIILNSKNEVVYNSGIVPTTNMLSISFINTDTRLLFEAYSGDVLTTQRLLVYNASDFVEFTSAINIVPAQAAQFANYVAEQIEPSFVYAVGYPGRTTEFAPGPGDAPGSELMTSVGEGYFTTSDGGLSFWAYNSGGISGGPVFNDQGQIAGLICSGDRLQNGLYQANGYCAVRASN